MTRKFEKYTYMIRSERRYFPLAKTKVGMYKVYERVRRWPRAGDSSISRAKLSAKS